MTHQTTALPHDPYITAVLDALTAAGLAPDSFWTSDAETDPYETGPNAGTTTMLTAVLIWEGTHQAVNEAALPEGAALIWDHPAPHWHWGVRGRHGALLNLPELLVRLGLWSHPDTVAATVRALLNGDPAPAGHAPYWHPADAVKTAIETWAAAETDAP